MPSRILSTDLQFDPERYEIMRGLGTGAAGAVFLVRDRETGEQLALKKLQRIDQKSVQRFKREFRSLAHVHHPNLIRLYDLGHAPGGWFLTMEYVQGRSLSEELLAAHDVRATRAKRPVAANDQGGDAAFVARVIGLFDQLASGVHAIHQAGMLHRDLKPSNVIVARDGRVVVLDFGLVRDIHSDAGSHKVTQDGTVPGTPAYMSPEQASAEPLSEASDWYAFGVMLYEMLSGQLPIGGTLSVETQLYAPLRAAWFAARTMRIALECGEPAGIARAMCLAGGLACISGTPRAARHAAELFARARELAKQCDSDDLTVEISTGQALAAMFLGRPLDVIEHSDAANRAYALKLAGGGHGDYFYRFAVNAARLAAMQSLGRHIQARAELRDYLERAQATGNRAAILQVTLTRALAERSIDNCATSRARLDAERPELPGGFTLLHLLHMIATMLAACSNHDYDWALATLEKDWPIYLQNVLHRTAYIASVAHFMHARLLLGRHVATQSVEDPERLIRPDVRVLRSLPESPYRDAVLSRLGARCAILTGELTSALGLFRDSAQLLDSASYLDEPERDRFAIGCLIGGSEGGAMCAAAEAKLRELGALVPREELQSFYPELFAAGLVGKLNLPK